MASSTAQHHRLPGSDEAAPYALCPFPTPSGTGQQRQQEVALFGGEDGILYVLPSTATDGTTTTTTEPRPVRTFDDRVRSLAVSDDGRRVAVGLESGETEIFAYDSPYSGDGDATNLHPFLNPASGSAGDDDGMGGMGDDDDDGFGGMMSQEDGPSPTKSSSSKGGVTEFAGPRFDAPIRALAFLPTPNCEKYYLAVATESPASFCVVDVKTAETAGGERYLQSEAEASHDSGGVRGLAVGKLIQVSSVKAYQFSRKEQICVFMF